MSRSGYCDDIDDPLALGRWRGQVKSAMRGRRGQNLLREMLAALDAMPDKRLIGHELEFSSERAEQQKAKWPWLDAETPEGVRDGDVCALGAVGKARGLDMGAIDPEDSETVALTFDVAEPLAREIVFMNDEGNLYPETPEQRWQRMRAWVAGEIVQRD
jgi:hypothetical protein